MDATPDVSITCFTGKDKSSIYRDEASDPATRLCLSRLLLIDLGRGIHLVDQNQSQKWGDAA